MGKRAPRALHPITGRRCEEPLRHKGPQGSPIPGRAGLRGFPRGGGRGPSWTGMRPRRTPAGRSGPQPWPGPQGGGWSPGARGRAPRPGLGRGRHGAGGWTPARPSRRPSASPRGLPRGARAEGRGVPPRPPPWPPGGGAPRGGGPPGRPRDPGPRTPWGHLIPWASRALGR